MNPRFIIFSLLALTGLLLFGYAVLPLLGPFLLSALLAYLCNPLVLRLQRRCSRATAVLLVFSLALCLLVLLVLIVVPMLARQLLQLYELLPRLLDWSQQTLLPWLQHKLELDEQIWHADKLKGMLLAHLDKTPDLATLLIRHVNSSVSLLLAWLGSVLLVPVLTYYLLLDWPQLVQRLERLIPRRYLSGSRHFFGQTHQVLSTFLHGQLSLMLVLGTLYAAGMALVGLELALVVGLLAGLASLVPNLGFIVGLLLALIAGLFQFGLDVYSLAFLVLVFVVVRVAEATLLTQALVADRLGLHPLTVTLALVIGGQLLGFTGILISLPVAALLNVVRRYLGVKYYRSAFYRQSEQK